MQVVFIVINDGNISLKNMKVFNHEADARKYQFERKRLLELEKASKYDDVTVYEKEVIE